MGGLQLPRIGVAPIRQRDVSGGALAFARPRYLTAVREAGGLPLVLGLIDAGLARDFVAGLDGLLLPGGRDIPPAWYGEKPEPELEEVLEDDLAEFYLKLAREAVEQRVPLLGVCLGFQVLNVALGGTLIQHLRPRVGAPLHRGPGQVDVRHDVEVSAGSRLHELLGRSSVETLSHHHQGLKDLATDLRVTARSGEGLPEGIELRGHPFCVGVQWHPERQPEAESSRRLFAGFVAAGRERQREAGRP